MCRKRRSCSLLGVDASLWSNDVLLPLPVEFEHGLEKFRQGVDAFLDGQRTASIQLIDSIDGLSMWNWYVEHGQMSGKHRNAVLKVPRPLFVGTKHALKAPTKFEKQVFARDGYRCRYCGVKVLSKQFVRKFLKALNYPGLRKVKGNVGTHGLFLLFWPVADHVLPHSLGGHTDLDNLVTTCGPCNYGKQEFTLEQLGLKKPETNFKKEDWDGLEGLVKLIPKVSE